MIEEGGHGSLDLEVEVNLSVVGMNFRLMILVWLKEVCLGRRKTDRNEDRTGTDSRAFIVLR